MHFPRQSLAVSALLPVLAGIAQAATDWSQIKAGMTEAEAVRCVGEPLLRTHARGFERWMYDGAGEILFSGGPLKDWSAAHPTAESLARPVEQDVLIRPARRQPRPPAPAQFLPPVMPNTSYEREAERETAFRYR